MSNRITGLATGLDIDALVSQTMQAYRSKIDVQQQKKDILEIKQKLYRDVIKESQDFYNDHFDVLKSGSLLNSNSWQSVKFTSSNESIVSVTGSSEARNGTFTVKGTTAKASSLEVNALGELKTRPVDGGTVGGTEEYREVIVNGQAFEIKNGSEREQATELNKKLTDAGINVTVRYTAFTSGLDSAFIFESKVIGKGNDFTVGGTGATGSLASGLEAKAATYSLEQKFSDLTNSYTTEGEFKLNIGDKEFKISISSSISKEHFEVAINEKLSKEGYSLKVNESDEIVISNTALGSGKRDLDIKINDVIKAHKFTDGVDATKAKLDISNTLSGKNVINGVYIDLDSKPTDKSSFEYINDILKNNNSNIELKENADNSWYLESKGMGSGAKIDFKTGLSGSASSGAEDADITITDEKGETYTHQGSGNSVTVDGMTFNFNGVIPDDGVTITSKKDATELTDKIKSFVEDYNELVTKLNTLVTEKRDRDYQPLTKDQREALSEKEVELWDSKVEKGQLRRDSDLMRLNDSLKEAMRSMVSGVGLNLKDIGIEPVIDYGGVKDGTFKINETKLKSSLENDPESVMNLFIKGGSSTTSTSSASNYSSTGFMNRIKDVLYNNTVTTKSNLIQKAGLEGTATSLTNTLTKSMENYTRKIQEMESLFASKEQALYTKFASLETMMNSYNSQLSYLTQSLGM